MNLDAFQHGYSEPIKMYKAADDRFFRNPLGALRDLVRPNEKDPADVSEAWKNYKARESRRSQAPSKGPTAPAKQPEKNTQSLRKNQGSEKKKNKGIQRKRPLSPGEGAKGEGKTDVLKRKGVTRQIPFHSIEI